MNSLVDYLGYILLRAATAFLTLLPVGAALFLGRVIGILGYYLDRKHRNIAYQNLKIALGHERSPRELKLITKKLYQNFSQNIVELLRLPAVTPKYLRRYISIEGEQYLRQALDEKKGFIFLAVHFGSWEIANMLGTMFGYRYAVITREQKRFRRLNGLLTSYRQTSGALVVSKGRGARDIIESLRQNEVVGLTADQGGKNGIFVDFFGKQASMSDGALRIALKMGVRVLPAFLIRKKGPYHIFKINPPLDLKPGADTEEIIRSNLAKMISGAEAVIRQYPEQYSWYYKVWKYSPQRTITILSDGKAGHLRQSEAVAKILAGQLKERNITPLTQTVEINIKNRLAKLGLSVSAFLSADHLCRGCLKCLKYFLDKDSCSRACAARGDFIISCGSSLAGLNLILSRENRAKNICVLKPGILSVNKFNAVIMPRHDDPPQRKNVFITSGTPNSVDADYLQEKKSALLARLPGLNTGRKKIGILIGGDTKKSALTKESLETLLATVKAKSLDHGLDILLTTSRRTCQELENLVKERLAGFSNCKLQIIANEKNLPEAVGGILALSRILVVTEDSISMVSEAAASGNPVIVLRFKAPQLDPSDRHDKFLQELSGKGHIIIASAAEVSRRIDEVLQGKITTAPLDDKNTIIEAVKSVI
jgi:Kdo2-lipid IVA lauroyltransferase/acyltransferase